MQESNIRILCSVLKVDIVYEAADGTLVPFFDTVAESPLMQSQRLRALMREGTAGQTAPFLRHTSYDCYFAGLRTEGGALYMGPMAHSRLSAVRRRQVYSAYGIKSEGLPILPVFTLPEIRNMVLLANIVLGNSNLENEDLLQFNRILNSNKVKDHEEQTRSLLKEEEENDDFSYRHSIFSGRNVVILRAVFALAPGDREAISARMRELAARRRASQPLDIPSAGSTFKRPVGGYASALIDQAGLRGYAIGGAQVSEKHAGFVVNAGGATAADILRLMEHIQQTVLAHSGIALEPEVLILGD